MLCQGWQRSYTKASNSPDDQPLKTTQRVDFASIVLIINNKKATRWDGHFLILQSLR
jgi:hypothetical protein